MKKHIFIPLLLCWVLTNALLSGQSRLAVMNFKNNGAIQYNYLESGIANMLSTTLASSREIRVVERVQLDKILEEMQLGLTGLVDPSTAAQVGKIAGAQYVVIGSFINLGRALRIDAKVVNVETTVILPGATAWVKTDIVENLDGVVQELADRLLSALTGENASAIIKADMNRPGQFEFTFVNLADYSVTIDGRELRPDNGTRGAIALKHGRYLFRIDRVHGMFDSEPVFQTYVDIPGGYIVRAIYKDHKFTIFETAPLPGSEMQVSSAQWNGAVFKSNFPPLSRVIIQSKTGLCQVFLDGEEKASLALPNVHEMAKATISGLRSGTYHIKVQGSETWYEGELRIYEGEEILIQTDPGKFKIVERLMLKN